MNKEVKELINNYAQGSKIYTNGEIKDKEAMVKALNELGEDKEIEELDFYKITDETIAGLRKGINILNNEYVDKINELVRELNELKKGK